MDTEIDIPQYFICPISLQIMKDPVTTITGITYDRQSIEQWLTTAADTQCPVTKLPLPQDMDLTPNHMLRRLIQAWCIVNAKNGIDRIPTPKSPLHRSVVLKLIRDVNNTSNNTLLRVNALKKMDELANESEKNQNCMREVGVMLPKAMIFFILRCFSENTDLVPPGIEEALRILRITWNSNAEIKQIVEDKLDFIQSLLWILNNSRVENNVIFTNALIILKKVMEIASSNLKGKLNRDFFKQMVCMLKINAPTKITKTTLQILIHTCPHGRNKTKIVESGAVFDLIEIELTKPDKKTTELLFCLLANLCSCADGRQQLLKHAGGIAVVAKRLLRVSLVSDDYALCVIESIARFSATHEVVMEMLRVGAVSKLCMVIQADCAGYLKKKAREILRLHSNAWSDSPCIQVYLFTRYPK